VGRDTFGLIGEEAIDLGNGAVVGHDGKSMIGGVQDEILAHDSQTDKAEVAARDRLCRSADMNAGKTGAEVSQLSRQSQSIDAFRRIVGKIKGLDLENMTQTSSAHTQQS
jgi:hypothetical protein